MNLRKLLPNLALAIGAPLFCFALAEGLLALAGVQPLSLTEDPYVGFSSLQPLFVDSAGADGRVYQVTNPAKLPHFNHQRFPKEKDPGVYRVFCLGGSTTYGHPFRDTHSFSGWLRAFLAKADTLRRFEVINAGGISYASYRVAALMEELSRYQPDLFVVYSGHNEFLEERTYRQLAALPPWLRNASAWLERTRTYSALKRLIQGFRGGEAAPAKGRPLLATEVDDVLAKTIGPTAYERNDSLKAGILAHFRFTVERMGRIADAAHAKILYVTTPVNEKDCSPFKSEPTPGLPGETRARIVSLAQIGDAFLASGHPDSAYLSLAEASRLDPRHAELRYRTGQAAYAAGYFTAAKTHLRAAIEEDICPLRALRSMDTSVRAAAYRHGNHLLDFVDTLENMTQARSKAANPAAFDTAANLGEPDFLDHVHLDMDDYERLALGLMGKMAEMGVLPASILADTSFIAPVADSLQKLMTPAERGLALTNLAKVINWAGKHEDAAHIAEKALRYDSTSLEAIWSSLFVGALRERQGRGLESLPHYRRAVGLDPSNAQSRMHLAGALMRLDSMEQAGHQFDTALGLDPQNPDIRQLYSEFLARQAEQQAESLMAAGQIDRAEKAFQMRLSSNPRDAQALEGLGLIAEKQGRYPTAIDYFAQALQVDASREKARAGLSRLLSGMPVR